MKEKVQSVINDAETAEDSDHPDTISTVSADMSSSDPQIKHHVEFKEPQILEEPVKEIVKVSLAFYLFNKIIEILIMNLIYLILASSGFINIFTCYCYMK